MNKDWIQQQWRPCHALNLEWQEAGHLQYRECAKCPGSNQTPPGPNLGTSRALVLSLCELWLTWNLWYENSRKWKAQKGAYLTRDLWARFQKQMVPSSPAVTIWVESRVNRQTLTAFPFGWTKWWILHPVCKIRQLYYIIVLLYYYKIFVMNARSWDYKNNIFIFIVTWWRRWILCNWKLVKLPGYSKGQYCHRWTR